MLQTTMNTYDEFDDLFPEGYGSHLFDEGDRFDGGDRGLIRFDPTTLRTRVVDRPYNPFLRHWPTLLELQGAYGPDALRRLAFRLVRGMLMPELRDSLPYTAVEALVKAAENALEPGRTSLDFDRLLANHRQKIESAGLLGWTGIVPHRYAAPPLLAAASLLDDDPWTALRTAYDLADWLDNVVSDGERDLLYAPARPDRVVAEFLAERGSVF